VSKEIKLMGRSLARVLTFTFAGSALAPLFTLVSSRYMRDEVFPWHTTPLYALVAIGILVLTLGVNWFLRRSEIAIEKMAIAQAEFLQALPVRYLSLAIFGTAALSLFLELAVIRWQATVFPFFAYYKNLSLLSCFAGLGLGYALARDKRVPLFLTVPLFCWQFILMLGMRYGMKSDQFRSLYVLPFPEQLNMGLPKNTQIYYGLQTYFILAVIFLLTALAFIPVGQTCGALMERTDKLSAYGYNLLGSLAGVLLMFAVSAFWTPPTLWFLIGLTGLLFFCVRRSSILLWCAGSVVLALAVLEWPVEPNWQRIYSPYQLLEVGRGEQGLLWIRAAGHYYQKVFDFSRPAQVAQPNAAVATARAYYDLPYRIISRPASVAVVGAGAGNDVAAALRAGTRRVDAIEIDPAILLLGRGHPEHPYRDPRVHAVVTDARSFLRSTDQHYDLIVFGLLDSHTLLSHASSVRLDSFVYTVQALKEARARLNPHGTISLAFSVLNDQLGRKIYLMLQQAFDGRAPLCIQSGYDQGVLFLASDDKQIVADPGLLAATGFQDRTAFYANEALLADLPTDDWPFFYMPRRVYPFSYLGMVALVLVLSLLLIANFEAERPRFSHFPFFLLGAGFMLIETKGITELGLTFGNTWQVIGVVIAAILVMAFLANCAVQWLRISSPIIPYVLLLVSLFAGWWIARSGGFPSTFAGRVATTIALTCPIFFSGIVFSTMLSTRGDVASVMGINLLGAMCGGLLEYNSMYFGFQFLYLLAAGTYLLGLMWELPRALSHEAAVVTTTKKAA
jgi:spermidine synthase